MAPTAVELGRLARSLGAKLNAKARQRGVAADVIRKQYVFTLFLSRLFDADPQPPWVLLGARTFAEYPSRLYPLDASLDEARACLDPILSGERTSGTWNRETRSWFE